MDPDDLAGQFQPPLDAAYDALQGQEAEDHGQRLQRPPSPPGRRRKNQTPIAARP